MGGPKAFHGNRDEPLKTTETNTRVYGVRETECREGCFFVGTRRGPLRGTQDIRLKPRFSGHPRGRDHPIGGQKSDTSKKMSRERHSIVRDRLANQGKGGLDVAQGIWFW